MGEVEHVAVWVGLFVGIASIALSVVAIVFTFVVNQRADQVSDATVKALQTIQDDVKSLKDDTRELIKDAWYRMLPVGPGAGIETNEGLPEQPEQAGTDAASPKETGRKGGEGNRTTTEAPGVEELIRDLQESVAKLQRSSRPTFVRTLDLVTALSTEAQDLARRLLVHGYLTVKQYQALMGTPLGVASGELRESRLITRLRSRARPEGEPPESSVIVYWFPTAQHAAEVRRALRLVPEAPADIQARVARYLRRVGYIPTGPGVRGIGRDAGRDEDPDDS
jgi:hypothetical protein